MRKTGRNGIEVIKRFEGFRETVYLCPGGKPTIGYGHVVRPDENLTNVTMEAAEELLREDLLVAEQAVNTKVTVYLCQHMFDALVSFVYNVGAGAFSRSTLLWLLNQGDYQGAANQFSRWTKAGGKQLQGLVLRRTWEKQLFLGET